MGFGTWLVRSSNSREGNQQLFLATCDGEQPRKDADGGEGIAAIEFS
jgi:hypothetical protein